MGWMMIFHFDQVWNSQSADQLEREHRTINYSTHCELVIHEMIFSLRG